MPTWKYDSYCNDNVMEYIEEYKNILLEDLPITIMDTLNDNPSESCLEFLVGIAMYGIRTGVLHDKKNILRILRDIIDYLLQNGKFKGWCNKEKRKQKLGYERKIIVNIIAGKKLKFGKLIKKPDEFKNLNDYY